MTVVVRTGLWIAALVTASAACSSTPRVVDPPQISLLLLPMNFDYRVPDALQPGLDVVAQEVVRQLEAEGFRVERVGLDEVVRGWPDAVREAGGLLDPETQSLDRERLKVARGAFVRSLVARHPADAVLLPTLVVRQGVMKKERVKWDGVYRRIPVGTGMTFDKSRLHFTGTMSASSVWSSLYSPDGARMASRYGGLEILQFVRQKKVKELGPDALYGTWYYEWVDRADLFQDASKLQKAVARSLEPALEKARGIR